MKRVLCLLLVLCMTLAMFVACNSDSNESKDATSGTESQGPKELVPHLEKRDLGGYTLTFLIPKDRAEDAYDECQFNTDEQIQESVNDASYERNRKIENEYSCNIETLVVDNSSKVAEKIREANQTQQPEFQVAAGGIVYFSSLASEGLLRNFNSMENSNINLEGDWWDQTAIRDISIANVLPFITGDIVVTDNEATWGIFFNKKMIEDNQLENPFQLVKDNEWTMDKMIEMANTVDADNDGDGAMTVTGSDTWGLLAQTYDGVAFMWGGEQAMVHKDANDIPSFRVSDPVNISTWDKVFELLVNQEYTLMADFFYSWNSPDRGIATKNFVDGKVLFNSQSISFVNSEGLRESTMSYGILPMPKRSAEQAEYSSSCTVYWATFLMIPTVVPESEIDKTTYLLEAMAYLGKEIVTPQYYEGTLKKKRVQDNDSPEMLELIFKNRTFDLASIYDWGSALYLYTDTINSKNNGIVANIDARIDAMNQAMNTTIEYFEALKDS
ncbi:MAG: extracellular solute-binding protein [Eubacteriales bacterium]|nr:extracellular solute-binding protein [Eubacteriales bacterium]MDD4476154.1 extracellular solute-binding protein [Eubacteriales bacterium]